jgi:hypothetical protein
MVRVLVLASGAGRPRDNRIGELVVPATIEQLEEGRFAGAPICRPPSTR